MCKCSEGDNQGAVTQEQEGPNLDRVTQEGLFEKRAFMQRSEE